MKLLSLSVTASGLPLSNELQACFPVVALTMVRSTSTWSPDASVGPVPWIGSAELISATSRASTSTVAWHRSRRWR